MKPNRKTIVALILLIFCVGIKWFSTDTNRVEDIYSTRFFPAFAAFLRKSLNGLEISIGDILYGSLVAWLIYKTGRILFFSINKRETGAWKLKLTKNIYTIFIFLCGLYIVFNLFWGINYNRKGIALQLGLAELKYSREELQEMNCLLILKMNAAKQNLLKSNSIYPGKKELFKGVVNAFEQAEKKYPFLQYKNPSIKSSLWGWFGNYAGFTGYYNPFTGEAQVNTTVPKFLQPFTSCHEVAHQLGYAKEMEANFVGYLAASSSSDPLFNYSVYLELFTYANRNLFMTDSLSAKLYRKELITPIKADIKAWALFNKKHRSVLEPIVRWGYGIFLQSNEQPQGILSYDEVTGFIIAYYKKFGKI